MYKFKKFIKAIVQKCIRPITGIYYCSVRHYIIRPITPKGQNAFFGYYDKCPWNKSQTQLLALQVDDAASAGDNDSLAQILVIDAKTKEARTIATTHCWNTQQGCMLQWLGPDFNQKIIFNDFENGNFIAKIFDVEQKRLIKTINSPIYDITKDGKTALSLDFTRLHTIRPGYGYKNIPCSNAGKNCPDEPCLWKINLQTNTTTPLLTYKQLAEFETRPEMESAFHKINHIMISPNGKRFMLLHRWYKNNQKFTRLITCDIDGKNLYNLSDDNMVSHCCWKNNDEILGFMNKSKTHEHYYLLKDKTRKYKMIWPGINEDGHCTYSHNGKYILSDTYPNIFGISRIIVGTESDITPKTISKFYSSRKFRDDVRCDLHPRWNYNDNQICIDSVNDGRKKIYIVDFLGKNMQ